MVFGYERVRLQNFVKKQVGETIGNFYVNGCLVKQSLLNADAFGQVLFTAGRRNAAAN